jgi:hypothetical protein
VLDSLALEQQNLTACYVGRMPRRLLTAKLLDRICAAAVELTKGRWYGGTQWITVSQVEDHGGTEVQRAILLEAQTGRLRFAGVPAHSISVKRKPPSASPANLDRVAALDDPLNPRWPNAR